MLLLVPLQFAFGAGCLVCVSDGHVGYSCHDSESALDCISDDLHEPDVIADTECGNCADMPIREAPKMTSQAASRGLEFQWAVVPVWFGRLDLPQVCIPLRFAHRGEASPFSARSFALTISPRV